MNWVDAAIITVIVVYALSGLRRGFLSVISDLAALAVGFAVAWLSFRMLGSFFAAESRLSQDSGEAMAFIGVWLLATFLVELVLGRMVRKLPKETRQSKVNRFLGLFPAALKGLIAAVLLVAVLGIRPDWPLGSDVERSTLAKPMLALANTAQRAVFQEFGDALQDLNRSRGETGIVEGSKPLGFTSRNGKISEAAENQMLVLLNNERKKAGLIALAPDAQLRDVARKHAQDMLARGYFAHVSPDGVKPSDRVDAAGISYGVTGENLAKAPTVEVAHTGLMNSDGHRKNILSPDYRRVGIGAVDAGLHGIVFAQEFAD